ncbi:serine hydrolase domain-containing protein [Allosphingosinicella indica]|uniref:CubicO group peptidase, beta-lactamase class C family n=1 Tax=Allosphingosinicella indica TaxID=941907 RepID=A0A1X7GN65_9SPHN|nr:serine hydrolase domain-containing protein [Allosphingosinicella indica]SMF72103.1 CubicO group peptidase, beta-lactamase class C family [Allosphingosinicella indica]
MRSWKLIAAAALAVLMGPAAVTQGPAPVAPVSPTVAPESVPPAPPAVPSGGAPLDRANVEAWLDGFMPYAMARGDIAGGVVVVVKDGQVLFEKGYGYSDVAKRKPVSADATLFRPGSVSKLLTWTAVMQLVEQGKLDLDRDVNTYLDFKIPAYDGKPVTLRNIMTHTAGFEESARYIMSNDPKGPPMSLEELMRDTVPRRIFAPGTTPAYSNYATALAGYIVARASGQSFDDYIDQHILRPLNMTRSSFRQPLPANLKPLMSQGYALGSGDPKPFEMVGPAPAGSLAATGNDMAKFMLAHLNQGQGLLRPETAKQMHETTLDIVPPLNRMALGFYEQNINGHRVIGHGGDTQWFHSYLWLFPDDNVGLYMSVNSAGKDGATGPLRDGLFTQFADRYFPAPLSTAKVDAETAKQHAQMMAGTYTNSRGHQKSFLSFLNLMGQVKLGVNADGTLNAPAVTGSASQPRKWVEIAPFVWRDAYGSERIAAKVENGQVVRWSFDAVSPFMMFDRVPWYTNSAWLMPAFLAALVIILLTALTWPAGWIARRRYKAALPFEGQALKAFRLTRGFAWATVLVVVGWVTFMSVAMADFTLLSGSLDWLLYILQALSPVVFFGMVGIAAWNLWLAWTGKRGWFSRTWSVLLLIGAVIVLWVALAFHLIGFGTLY